MEVSRHSAVQGKRRLKDCLLLYAWKCACRLGDRGISETVEDSCAVLKTRLGIMGTGIISRRWAVTARDNPRLCFACSRVGVRAPSA